MKKWESERKTFLKPWAFIHSTTEHLLPFPALDIPTRKNTLEGRELGGRMAIRGTAVSCLGDMTGV